MNKKQYHLSHTKGNAKKKKKYYENATVSASQIPPACEVASAWFLWSKGKVAGAQE